MHILSQRLGHGPVAFISVHDCRQDILFAAHNVDCALVGVMVKLFCEVITAVVVKISGIDIKNQLAEFFRTGFQATGGNYAVCHHLIEHGCVAVRWCFEVDIHALSFRHNILINIAFFFPFIVSLSVHYFIGCHSHISCAGTVNTIASCHRHFPPVFFVSGAGSVSGEHFCGSVITHYDTFILRLQSIVGSPRGDAASADASAVFPAWWCSRNPQKQRGQQLVRKSYLLAIFRPHPSQNLRIF